MPWHGQAQSMTLSGMQPIQHLQQSGSLLAQPGQTQANGGQVAEAAPVLDSRYRAALVQMLESLQIAENPPGDGAGRAAS